MFHPDSSSRPEYKGTPTWHIPNKHKMNRITSNRPPNGNSGSKLKRAFKVYADETTAERITPWALPSSPEGSENSLGKEIERFCTYMSPTAEEHALRELQIKHIRDRLVTKWPGANVMAFGSFATDTYLPTGDIDITVIFPFSLGPLGHRRHALICIYLEEIHKILAKSGIVHGGHIISSAKVPIIRAVTSQGRFPIDVSVDQSGGRKAAAVVRQYLTVFPALRPLLLILKIFLELRNLHKVHEGGISSYTLICLIVSMLQLEKKNGGNRDLGDLLLRFLELYGKQFDLNKDGISLRNGGHYFCQQDLGSLKSKRDVFCIEDPADLQNNLSKGSFNSKAVCSAFSKAFDALTASCEVSCEVSKSRKSAMSSGKAVGLEAISILRAIVWVTPEMFAHVRPVPSASHRQIDVDSSSSAKPSKRARHDPPPGVPEVAITRADIKGCGASDTEHIDDAGQVDNTDHGDGGLERSCELGPASDADVTQRALDDDLSHTSLVLPKAGMSGSIANTLASMPNGNLALVLCVSSISPAPSSPATDDRAGKSAVSPDTSASDVGAQPVPNSSPPTPPSPHSDVPALEDDQAVSELSSFDESCATTEKRFDPCDGNPVPTDKDDDASSGAPHPRATLSRNHSLHTSSCATS